MNTLRERVVAAHLWTWRIGTVLGLLSGIRAMWRYGAGYEPFPGIMGTQGLERGFYTVLAMLVILFLTLSALRGGLWLNSRIGIVRRLSSISFLWAAVAMLVVAPVFVSVGWVVIQSGNLVLGTIIIVPPALNLILLGLLGLLRLVFNDFGT